MEKIANIYIVYELDKANVKTHPTLVNCWAVSITKNADIDKNKYSGYGTGFDRAGFYLLRDGNFGGNVIFGVDMSSSAHVDNKGKYILILGTFPTQGLGEHPLTAEKICLIIKFKAKDSNIIVTPLCLGNISKDWSVDNMKDTGLNGYVYDFSVDYDATDVDDIKDIHKYLMKKNNIV